VTLENVVTAIQSRKVFEKVSRLCRVCEIANVKLDSGCAVAAASTAISPSIATSATFAFSAFARLLFFMLFFVSFRRLLLLFCDYFVTVDSTIWRTRFNFHFNILVEQNETKVFQLLKRAFLECFLS
jgi:hypothetical protein